MHSLRHLLLGAVCASALASHVRAADTIYSFDFEAGNVPSTTIVDVAFGALSRSIGVDDTAGVGGGGALVATYNADGSTAYFRYQFSDNTGPDTLATSANLADYTVSFDIRAVGLLTNPITNNFTVSFGGGSVALTMPAITISDTFQTVTLGLDQYSAISGTFTAAAVNSEVAMRIEIFGTGSKFGADAGNQIIMDNFSITQASAIPEPSSAALLAGLGALALGACRRRRT